MPKNKFFRFGKTPITAAQFGEKLAKELQGQQEQILDNLADIYVSELEKLLNRLRKSSAQRGLGVYAARYNDPFANAKVVIQRTRTGMRIFVDDKRFQYLDEGRPEKIASKTVKFPAYARPTATDGVSIGKPGSLLISKPAHIIALDGPARVVMGSFMRARPKDLDSFIDITDSLNQPWVTVKAGKTIQKRKPRNFYLAIKKIVDASIKAGRLEQRDLISIRELVLRDAIKTSIERR